MGATINKNSSATILTIRNFENLVTDGSTPVEHIEDIAQTESDTMLFKFLGPSMTIDFDYYAVQEATDVVSGTGSPVTTSEGQYKYLFDTLMSKGADQITDTY